MNGVRIDNKGIKPVLQEEKTGCAIACVAMLSGLSYARAKGIAGRLGIAASDPKLWSDTAHVRKLLAHLNVKVSAREKPFKSWNELPDRAVLAIKWHREKGIPFWHWTIFIRDAEGGYVLDPKKALKNNIRTDFSRMKPKWFIEVLA